MSKLGGPIIKRYGQHNVAFWVEVERLSLKQVHFANEDVYLLNNVHAYLGYQNQVLLPLYHSMVYCFR